MVRKGWAGLLISLLIIFLHRAYAGTVTGQIQVASSGKGVANGTLTFTLSQAAVVSGTATIVTTPVNCYTDALGNVVGLPNPQSAPVLSTNTAAGTLPAGNYFVRTTWANSSGETVGSTESSRSTTQTGTLIVQAPRNAPANATQWKIYIGTASGAETLQATQNAPFDNYSQASALIAGTALPGTNSSVCSLRFNDELQPSYTNYNVMFTTLSGAAVPGFPQRWYLNGGSTGTINVSSGLPLFDKTVVYPQPIVTSPANNAQQSISGPLNLNGFGLKNAGTVTNWTTAGPSPWIDVTDPAYGAKCDGTTPDDNAFSLAIATAKTGGGCIAIPTGKTCALSAPLDFSNTIDVCVAGLFPSNGMSMALNKMPALKYTGSASPFINFGGSNGFSVEHVQILYSNTAFTGVLAEGHSTSGETSNMTFRNVLFSGNSGATGAGICLSLDTTISSQVLFSNFHTCAVGVQGAASSASFSNAIMLIGNSFSSAAPFGDISDSMIKNPTSGWTVSGNTFEMGSPNVKILGTTSGVGIGSFDFEGNWAGDCAATYGGTFFGPLQGPTSGWDIHGNYLVCNGNSGIFFDQGTASFFGKFDGNSISNFGTGFKFNSSNSLIDMGINAFGNISTFKINSPFAGRIFDPSDSTTYYGTQMFSAGLQASSISINGDSAQTANSRAWIHCYIRITNNSPVNWCTTIPEKAISVASIQVLAQTPPSGCTTSPTFGIPSTAATCSLTNGSIFCQVNSLNVNLTGGVGFNIGVINTDAGCTTQPADINVLLQVKMQ
jgi:hypothetical protein